MFLSGLAWSGTDASAQVATVANDATVLSVPLAAAAPPPRMPDAPQPNSAAVNNAGAGANLIGPSASGDTNAAQLFLFTSNSRYNTELKPGEKRVPFSVREKFIYSIRESISTEEVFVFTLGAGYNHFINGNPRYGTDGNGFGERVGTSALREASVHILGDGVMASALHQDPRYFTVGRGHPFIDRVKHVVASAVTSHSDRDGHVQPDYSGMTGRAATAAMTLAYYPHVSATNTIAAETFGYSLLGDMAGNALLEFLPDFLHPRHNPAP
jgi:hypothetical protein